MLLVLLAGPPVLLALLYAGGYLAQFIANYNAWKQAGGYPGDGTSPMMPSASFLTCIQSVFTPPYGVFGIFICAGLLLLLIGTGDENGFQVTMASTTGSEISSTPAKAPMVQRGS